ncbi:MAG: sensor histidine kinase [Gemmatimonadales bacterium]
MTIMTVAFGGPAIQPLFATNERLWLRVWLATQTAALGVVVGLRAYGWMIRHAWAVGVFVPAGWVDVLLSNAVMFGVLMLYIHRANRGAATRARLLGQLDEAQRGLAERAHEAGAQEERQRLARDIHDTLAQGFTSVIKHLEAIELSFERSPAIGHIVTQWSEANAIEATCVIGELPALHLGAEVTCLRATQESLSNVARHANASRVAVTLDCVDGLLLLSVEDDGRGVAEAEDTSAGRMGIAGIRERVRPFGGRVIVESGAGTGTSITVALPLAAIAAVQA